MEWTRGRTIGRGSTATVSLAVSASSQKRFVVKSTELSRSMLLQREQLLLSKLSSPYLVKYIGFDVSDENSQLMYNLCMEYVPGGSLHDVIRRRGGRLDESMIRLYTRHILLGLDYLHKNGLVHCDVKSQNVLVNEDGAKIADLGCARFVEDVACNGGSAASVFSGTPAFMAPEVVRGEEQGFPADVWAVGCTIIEMATGSNPWSELNDPVSALYRIGFSSDVPQCPSWLSDKGKDFLSKCLSRDPKDRSTAGELLEHPFLDEQELDSTVVKEFTTSSPSCVLDQDYWNSVEAFESPQDLTIEGCSDSPGERIEKLIESSVLNVPNWTWDEDWITVRSEDFEEALENEEPSDATEILSSDSIDYDQEFTGSVIDEDLPLELNSQNVSTIRVDDLPLEFNTENINRRSRDVSSGSIDGSVSNLSILWNEELVLDFLLNLCSFCSKINNLILENISVIYKQIGNSHHINFESESKINPKIN